MSVKLLTEQHLEFISLKGGCTGSFESTLVKILHCWKSHVMAQILHTMSIQISWLMKKLLENQTITIDSDKEILLA